jgi:hypothetical protein
MCHCRGLRNRWHAWDNLFRTDAMLEPQGRSRKTFAKPDHRATGRRSTIVGFRFQRSQVVPTLSVEQADRHTIAMNDRVRPTGKDRHFCAP